MEEDQDYQMVEPFYVDDGELDGLSPQQIFVLGFEFSQIRTRLFQEMAFDMPFHSENESRVRKMLDRHNAVYEIYIHDDWPQLVVTCGLTSNPADAE